MNPFGRQTADSPNPMALNMNNRAQEVYEQLLALADKIGAAYVEAYQEIGAAYVEAYQKLALPVGGMQHQRADNQQPGRPGVGAFPTAAPAADRLGGANADPLGGANDRARAVADNLTDMGVKIGLACLDANEQATLAAAKAHEEIGATSSVDVVKATAASQAALARKVTQASTSAVREIVD
jgi:hypothetical protein